MMTSAQVVERQSMSPQTVLLSTSQDYTHPDDHNLPIYDMTPGFKPFTMFPSLTRPWESRIRASGTAVRLHAGYHRSEWMRIENNRSFSYD